MSLIHDKSEITQRVLAYKNNPIYDKSGHFKYGELIRFMRERRNMTQEELGKLINEKIILINEIEEGIKKVSEKKVDEISNILKFEVSFGWGFVVEDKESNNNL